MRGIFTRDERIVMTFLVVAVSVGSLVVAAGKVRPPRDGWEGAGPSDTLAGAAEDVPLLVDINTADAALLEELPGIGPAKALAILALRGERGAFASVEELDDVKGIGPATLERLRPYAVAGDSVGKTARERPRPRNDEGSEDG